MRIHAISDVHVDYAPNMDWLRRLASGGHRNDALLLAGDVTDDIGRLEEVFRIVGDGFGQVFFVPGNHELWVRRGRWRDSFEKFEAVLDLCRSYRIHTEPRRLGGAANGLWVVPLFSWYVEPQEGASSLFVPKCGEDPTLSNWSDKYFVRWPQEWAHAVPAFRFLEMNEVRVNRVYDAPVISFSHFLPRRELMYSPRPLGEKDLHPEFNFSRVAGCSALDEQIRRLGSSVHVYGHQHRNRDVTLDGVRYLSHCRGYPLERARGFLAWGEPDLKLAWDSEIALSRPRERTTAPVPST
jgi:predicted phosphodiesterase